VDACLVPDRGRLAPPDRVRTDWLDRDPPAGRFLREEVGGVAEAPSGDVVPGGGITPRAGRELDVGVETIGARDRRRQGEREDEADPKTS